MRRLSLCLLPLLFAAACGGGNGPPTPPPKPTMLQRACQWLWMQQSEDGGWHSPTYGLMRSGQSLTPYVLHALMSVPVEKAQRPEGGVERALEFIRKNTNTEGCLGRADPDIADYPTHATAYGVRCLVAAGNEKDRPLIKRMCACLKALQFGPERGIAPDSVRWGGWGFGSEGHPGVMDIGHTRHALQALSEAGELDRETAERAQAFLRMVQRHPDDKRPQPPVPGEPDGDASDTFDGGFYFSPADTGMNKGWFEPAVNGRAAWFRSYATPTCDGLLSLLAAGVARDDGRVKAVTEWLDKHPGLDRPAGVPTDGPSPWYAAIHHYHLAVRAEAWAAIGRGGDWRAELERTLAPTQRTDGSFVNEDSPLMKEDDPVLCTTFCVIALAN
ncbi:MAG: terpene cyclase/mutase family protein [Planctomycetes bacterium]|nr:terpene cyclase/mutase family protein [Planctomycetota bacterium]